MGYIIEETIKAHMQAKEEICNSKEKPSRITIDIWKNSFDKIMASTTEVPRVYHGLVIGFKIG